MTLLLVLPRFPHQRCPPSPPGHRITPTSVKLAILYPFVGQLKKCLTTNELEQVMEFLSKEIKIKSRTVGQYKDV